MNDGHIGRAGLAVLGIAGTAAWLLLPQTVAAFDTDLICDSIADGDADRPAVRGRSAGSDEARQRFAPGGWKVHCCLASRTAGRGVGDGRIGPTASDRRPGAAWPLVPHGRAPPEIRS